MPLEESRAVSRRPRRRRLLGADVARRRSDTLDRPLGIPIDIDPRRIASAALDWKQRRSMIRYFGSTFRNSIDHGGFDRGNVHSKSRLEATGVRRVVSRCMPHNDSRRTQLGS